MKITASAIGLLAAIPSVLGVWPIPRTLKEGSSNSEVWWVNIKPSGNVGSIVSNAIQRYQDLINKESFQSPVTWNVTQVKTNGSFGGVSLSVESTDETLNLDTDESYTLDVPVSGEATLKAKTPYGALRGLETLSQLVVTNGASKAIRNTPIHIEDSPFFPHRGIQLDTARNYLPISALKRTIDAMSYNKLNVLHWHIVDSQSWPVESKTFPDLQKNGAYSAKETYSHAEVRDLIQYAKGRGVRIIPEFDVPGHTYIVGKARPDLMSCMNMQPNWDQYAAEPPSGQLNIAKPETIEFTNKLVKEYTGLFTDNVFHLGGDEVNRKCWKEDPDVQKYLAAHPGEDVETLLASWYSKVHEYLGSLNRTAYTWEETLFHSTYEPPKDTIVQTWIDEQSIPKTVSKGYRSVASPASYYYLDCGHGAWLSNWVAGNSWCDPFKTWMKIYSFDPLTGITDPAQQKLVLGGEVQLWAEQSDETVLDNRLWPRAAAMAETTWSGKKDATGRVRTTEEVASRLHEQRFRMVDRGISAGPMQPVWCVRNPGHCNLP
ncbi:beta-hexosaminidase-like protein [Linderina pennispora]|uniref:Beta-hexosaminidase n=1 Tax=Linderina pennispora TaxID=61395 RepID=A0A1Y1W8Z1_9FUNG|nr:beta-hexosaminidase-like protein [Linderina pennispora]ORX70000.1 beta-hexosaminidase-like protein [Linderina pennispora]